VIPELALPRLLTTEEKMSLKPQVGKVESVVANASRSVEAVWGWYEKRRGVVVWGLRNVDSRAHQVILFRNSYYFGDAYWSVYGANRSFQVTFLDGRVPAPALTEKKFAENSPPLGLVQFEGFPQTIVCSVFTLSAGQTWAMIEGGFSPSREPSGVSVYDVSPLIGGEFCLTYDPQGVTDWDRETRTALGGYEPNPSTFNTWLFQAESAARFRKQFDGDEAASGRCAPIMAESPGSQEERVTYEGGIFPAVFPDILSPPLNP
jgi:hypothetical protein